MTDYNPIIKKILSSQAPQTPQLTARELAERFLRQHGYSSDILNTPKTPSPAKAPLFSQTPDVLLSDIHPELQKFTQYYPGQDQVQIAKGIRKLCQAVGDINENLKLIQMILERAIEAKVPAKAISKANYASVLPIFQTIFQLEQECEKSELHQQQLTQQLSALTEEQERALARIESQELEKQRLQQQNDTLAAEKAQLATKSERLSQELAQVKQEFEEKELALNRQIETLRTTTDQTQARIVAVQAEAIETASVLQELTTTQQSNTVEKQQLEEKLQLLTSTKETLEQQLQQQEATIQNKHSELQLLQQEKEEFIRVNQQEKQRLEESIALLQTRETHLQKEIQELTLVSTDLTERLQRRSLKLEEKNTEIQRVTRQLLELQQKLDQTEESKQATETMVAAFPQPHEHNDDPAPATPPTTPVSQTSEQADPQQKAPTPSRASRIAAAFGNSIADVRMGASQTITTLRKILEMATRNPQQAQTLLARVKTKIPTDAEEEQRIEMHRLITSIEHTLASQPGEK